MINFFSSNLFSNFLAILGIVLSLLPQNNNIAINNSTNYYFDISEKHNSKEYPFTTIFLGGIILVTTYILYTLLIRPTKYIKVMKVKDIVLTIFLFSIIISFMFFTNPHSPARIATEKINYFLSN